MTHENVEVENKQPARKFTFKGLREYETIMTRAAASMLCQLEYWWPKRKGPEFYKTDQEFADEIGISLSHFKAIKKYLSKIIKLFKTRVAFLNGKKVTYYGEIDYAELDRLIRAKKDILKSENNTLVKYENQTLLDQSKVRKTDHDGTKNRLCTLYTGITTDITNNPAGLENNLPFNQSGLGNLSNGQKSGSEEDRSAFREESLDAKTPTPNSEQSKQEEKAVEPPLPTLKAEDAEAPKKSKDKGKNKKQGSLTEEEQAQFEQWYAHYPKKEGRYRAEQAFVEAIHECDLNTMISLTQKYAKRVKDEKKETQHIKLPTTWLNSKPWKDLKDIVIKETSKSIEAINIPEEIRVFLDKPSNSDISKCDFADCIFEDRGDRIVIKAKTGRSRREIEFYEGRLGKHFGKDVCTELFSKDEPIKLENHPAGFTELVEYGLNSKYCIRTNEFGAGLRPVPPPHDEASMFN